MNIERERDMPGTKVEVRIYGSQCPLKTRPGARRVFRETVATKRHPLNEPGSQRSNDTVCAQLLECYENV